MSQDTDARMLAMSRFAILSVLLFSIAVGCSSSETSTPQAKQQPAKQLDPAAVVAKQFMERLSKGQIESAEQLLSEKSRERLKAAGLGIFDPGLASENYTVGAVERSSDRESVVHCTITSPAAEGQAAQQADICWGMRLDDGDWRIVGFVAEQNGMSVVWNFESDEGPRDASSRVPASPEQGSAAAPASTAQSPNATGNEVR